MAIIKSGLSKGNMRSQKQSTSTSTRLKCYGLIQGRAVWIAVLMDTGRVIRTFNRDHFFWCILNVHTRRLHQAAQSALVLLQHPLTPEPHESISLIALSFHYPSGMNSS